MAVHEIIQDKKMFSMNDIRKHITKGEIYLTKSQLIKDTEETFEKNDIRSIKSMECERIGNFSLKLATLKLAYNKRLNSKILTEECAYNSNLNSNSSIILKCEDKNCTAYGLNLMKMTKENKITFVCIKELANAKMDGWKEVQENE